MKKILLIGCGHMGNALLASWVKSKLYLITVVDPIKHIPLKKKYKNKKIKILKNINNLDYNLKFNFIIFATKPIDLNSALKDLSQRTLNKNTIIISVVAGKKISILENKFSYLNNFFRVMPNMPALIGESMNCIVSNENAKKIIKNQVLKLFSYSGKTIFLENENQIDMSTAISGSGPGFVFNLIDAMEKAAYKLGFNKKISKILVNQTFKGSINLLLQYNMSAEDLVNTVATKGGTTEAGLKIMKKNNLHKVFVKLTKASYNKAKDQGK